MEPSGLCRIWSTPKVLYPRLACGLHHRMSVLNPFVPTLFCLASAQWPKAPSSQKWVSSLMITPCKGVRPDPSASPSIILLWLFFQAIAWSFGVLLVRVQGGLLCQTDLSSGQSSPACNFQDVLRVAVPHPDWV